MILLLHELTARSLKRIDEAVFRRGLLGLWKMRCVDAERGPIGDELIASFDSKGAKKNKTVTARLNVLLACDPVTA